MPHQPTASNGGEGLRAALEQCRDQFRFYEREHMAAGKVDKASTNRTFADLADAALAQPVPRSDIEAAYWEATAHLDAPAVAVDTFQSRVRPWLLACFGEMIAGDRGERNHRFLEESLELVQSTGCTASEAHQLVDYVYGRDVGEPQQEVGGVMVTLAALCLANDLDMHGCGEVELARVWTKVEAIRAKQAAKPKHSPLPQHAPAFCPARQDRPADEALDAHLPESVRGEKRCGIQRSDWLPGWFVPWSPRNENQNAEGPWSHWVALAHAIIAADQKAILSLPLPAQDEG